MNELLLGLGVVVLLYLFGRPLLNSVWDGVTSFMGWRPTRRLMRAGELRLTPQGRSTARIEAAARANRIGTVSALLLADGQQEAALAELSMLAGVLPGSKAGPAVRMVGREIIDLTRNVGIARQAGVPTAVTERLEREVGVAASAFWDRVDRISAVTEMVGVGPAPGSRARKLGPSAAIAGGGWAAYPGLAAALDVEARRLTDLYRSMHEATMALAELTLSGGRGRSELGRVESRFHMLADTARTIMAEDLS